MFRIALLPDCDAYRGHFPGHPVCPGAFSIQVVKECAMELAGKELRIRTIKQCRLMSVVSPASCAEVDVAVSLTPAEGGLEVAARMTAGGRTCMEYKGLMSVV